MQLNTKFINVIERNTTFDSEGFIDLVNLLSCPLLSYANYALNRKDKHDLFNTLFLGKTHSVASRLEEVLDYYNSKNNQQWRPFREHVAAIKVFTDVAYITLHLKSASPQYKLLSGIDLFLKETDEIMDTFALTLCTVFQELIKISKKNGLKRCSDIDKEVSFSIDFPQGRLDSDLKKHSIDNPEQVIVNLATSYLNLASESEVLYQIESANSKNYEELVPNVVNENKIRILENKFHNLQSLYDTYISNTDIEDLDNDLRLIRGHASIVYHLLEASTNVIHYYERHIMKLPGSKEHLTKSPLKGKKVLKMLVDYYLNYTGQFLTAGVNLCKDVIKKYAEEGSVAVKVPSYRGFHVRPSTLVSKIVQHYGSDVYLVMGDDKYNASLPMELFRVNEKINAEKRRNLANSICSLHSVNDPECNNNYSKGLKEVFHELLEENKIINYASEFSLPDLTSINEETLGEFANRAIAYLLAQGKIDLKTDLKVHFEGDKRVLADLEVLANCGYGEDCYGNNIVLPKELSYLRR